MNDFIGIQDCVQNYLDGLYSCDTHKLEQVFHPQAHYVGAPDGELLIRSIQEYLSIVAAREPGSQRGEQRHEAIEAIEFAGEDTALVRLHCRIGPRFFIDLLSIIRCDGRWRIICKLFHTEIKTEVN